MLALLVDAVSVLGAVGGANYYLCLVPARREAQSPAGASVSLTPMLRRLCFVPGNTNTGQQSSEKGRTAVDEQRFLQEIY